MSFLAQIPPEKLKSSLEINVMHNRNITKEDIENLVKERNNLLIERKNLKARIARLEMQSKRANRTAHQNQCVLTHVDQEYRAIEHEIVEKRAEINSLISSDKAAQWHELRESIRLAFEEQLRLQDQQVEKQIYINDTKAQWEELMRTDGPDVYQCQKEIIEQLKQKLEKYKKSNMRLEKKIQTLRDKRDIQNDIQDKQPGGTVSLLRAQIKQAENASAGIEDRIQKAITKHSEVMKQLHNRLLQSGLDATTYADDNTGILLGV